jgi:hypothetical protein
LGHTHQLLLLFLLLLLLLLLVLLLLLLLPPHLQVCWDQSGPLGQGSPHPLLLLLLLLAACLTDALTRCTPACDTQINTCLLQALSLS